MADPARLENGAQDGGSKRSPASAPRQLHDGGSAGGQLGAAPSTGSCDTGKKDMLGEDMTGMPRINTGVMDIDGNEDAVLDMNGGAHGSNGDAGTNEDLCVFACVP